MTEQKIKHHIETEMRLRPTEELVEIWTQNKRAEWTDATFEVVHAILSERLETLPEQQPPNYHRTDLGTEDAKRFLTSTWFLTDGLAIVTFVLSGIGA